MSMIHGHDTPAQAPDGRQSTLAIQRPTWADEIVVDQDMVTHLWTAPTVATGGIFAGAVGGVLLPVEVQQIDDVQLDENSVTYQQGQPVVFLAEADIAFSPTEARRYAAAIIEACDRLDTHQGER